MDKIKKAPNLVGMVLCDLVRTEFKLFWGFKIIYSWLGMFRWCDRTEPHHNIFSGKRQPLNQDYFKTLWSRFKRQSTLIEQGQTLYSFRHSGAIEIFKRTGSITKLQKAMGHSSINVSLTYLRGLEIADLKEEDMPMV